jgi:hypothetical protein
MNLSGLFSRANQNRATWITFIIACATNVVLLVFFDTNKEGENPSVSNFASFLIFILNIIQAFFAVFVLLLFLVVKIPVKYQSLEALGHDKFETLLYTATDPMTIYYVLYLCFVFLAAFVAYDFLPFLLLDIIVKNSTTLDVLKAVIVPRKQIALGCLVIIFISQIYAFFLVSIFSSSLYSL